MSFSPENVTIALDERYRLKEAVTHRATAGSRGMAVNMESGDMLELNETAVAVIPLLDGKRPLGEVVQELAKKYGIPAEQIEDDVVRFVNKLARTGFVEGANRKAWEPPHARVRDSIRDC